MAQLPSGSIGAAVFAMAVAVIALTCGVIMLWLTWRHERYSYVALIGWFSILTTLVTMGELAYYIISWRDIYTASTARRNSNMQSDDPHLWIALTFGMSGFDLANFWIMMCGYTIESMLVMFWAIELAASVIGVLGKPGSILNKSHNFVLKYGKIMAIAIPVVDYLLLQIPAIQNTDMAWFIMTHSILLGSLIVNIVVICLIFWRYLDYRRKVQNMLCTSRGPSQQRPASSNTANHHGLYDRWLLPRFGVIILFLMFFESFNIAMQISNWRLMLRSKAHPTAAAPVNSATTASWLMIISAPRCLPGVALLLVFGTTKVFRARMYRAFWPKRWQRHDQLTPLQTPYQSSKAGGRWYEQAPRINLRLTSASLRWNHGDQTFAAWESRRLENRRPSCMLSTSQFGSSTVIISTPVSPHDFAVSPLKSPPPSTPSSSFKHHDDENV